MKHKDSAEKSSPFISENEVRGTSVRVWPVVDEAALGAMASLEDECNLRLIVIACLGGVGALSREHYKMTLETMAKSVGRVVDNKFRAEVKEILASLPCPLD